VSKVKLRRTRKRCKAHGRRTGTVRETGIQQLSTNHPKCFYFYYRQI